MLYVGWHDAIDDETKDDGTITLTVYKISIYT
jgi:hypothetical protein